MDCRSGRLCTHYFWYRSISLRKGTVSRMNLTDKQAISILVVSMVLIGSAIAVFSVFQDSNHLMDLVATLAMCAGVLIITWLKFYSSIKPLWIGIFFSTFLFVITTIILIIINKFISNKSNLLGIPIVFGLALLIHVFEKPLSKFLLSIFKRG